MKVRPKKRLAMSLVAAGALGISGVAAHAFPGCEYESNSSGYYGPDVYYRTYSAPVTIERPVYTAPYYGYGPRPVYVHVERPFNAGRAAGHAVNFGLGALFHLF